MDERTIITLKQLFKEYYFKNAEKVDVPTRIAEREFGYMPFGGGMIRHLSFHNRGELTALLVKEAPSSVYYSCAYYFEPTLPMDEKGLNGADMIFDIDADDLALQCKMDHDRWICRKCFFEGVGIRPEVCPRCQSNRIGELSWACDICLGEAKREALKLIDFLIEDFGLRRDEITAYFSGNMGYHISLQSSAVEFLDQRSRAEISDYISGLGLIPESLGITPQSDYETLISKLPLHTEPGWRGRIARYFKDQIFEGLEDMPNMDVRSKIASIYGKLGYMKFRRLLEEAAKKVGVAIDTNVTTDIHRIFRLPETLHGETGLIKKRCDNLDDFDPFTDSVAFSEEAREVAVHYSPRFRIGEHIFGPFRSQKVKLPTSAAVYLMARGLAEAV